MEITYYKFKKRSASRVPKSFHCLEFALIPADTFHRKRLVKNCIVECCLFVLLYCHWLESEHVPEYHTDVVKIPASSAYGSTSGAIHLYQPYQPRMQDGKTN